MTDSSLILITQKILLNTIREQLMIDKVPIPTYISVPSGTMMPYAKIANIEFYNSSIIGMKLNANFRIDIFCNGPSNAPAIMALQSMRNIVFKKLIGKTLDNVKILLTNPASCSITEILDRSCWLCTCNISIVSELVA